MANGELRGAMDEEVRDWPVIVVIVVVAALVWWLCGPVNLLALPID